MPYTKSTQNELKTNARFETEKIIEENRETPPEIGVGADLMKQTTETKIREKDYIKLKSSSQQRQQSAK
jgi:hypothetical protein